MLACCCAGSRGGGTGPGTWQVSHRCIGGRSGDHGRCMAASLPGLAVSRAARVGPDHAPGCRHRRRTGVRRVRGRFALGAALLKGLLTSSFAGLPVDRRLGLLAPCAEEGGLARIRRSRRVVLERGRVHAGAPATIANTGLGRLGAGLADECMPRASGMITGTDDAADSRTGLAGGPGGRTLNR